MRWSPSWCPSMHVSSTLIAAMPLHQVPWRALSHLRARKAPWRTMMHQATALQHSQRFTGSMHARLSATHACVPLCPPSALPGAEAPKSHGSAPTGSLPAKVLPDCPSPSSCQAGEQRCSRAAFPAPRWRRTWRPPCLQSRRGSVPHAGKHPSVFRRVGGWSAAEWRQVEAKREGRCSVREGVSNGWREGGREGCREGGRPMTPFTFPGAGSSQPYSTKQCTLLMHAPTQIARTHAPVGHVAGRAEPLFLCACLDSCRIPHLSARCCNSTAGLLGRRAATTMALIAPPVDA